MPTATKRGAQVTAIDIAPGLKDFAVGEQRRIASGFYTSYAMELRRR